MRKSALLVLVASLLVVVGNSSAQDFVIDPTLQWQGTGFQVNVGDCIHITASGIISASSPTGPHSQVNPTGCRPYIPGSCEDWGTHPEDTAGSGYLVPGVLRYSLVGRINSGTPFEVGTDFQMVSTEAGELELAFNDEYYPDNSGQFDVWIAYCSSEIPTLTEWGMIIFAVLLLGFMAYVVIRRRKSIGIGV
jgi:hypothetical protein